MFISAAGAIVLLIETLSLELALRCLNNAVLFL